MGQPRIFTCLNFQYLDLPNPYAIQSLKQDDPSVTQFIHKAKSFGDEITTGRVFILRSLRVLALVVV